MGTGCTAHGISVVLPSHIAEFSCFINIMPEQYYTLAKLNRSTEETSKV